MSRPGYAEKAPINVQKLNAITLAELSKKIEIHKKYHSSTQLAVHPEKMSNMHCYMQGTQARMIFVPISTRCALHFILGKKITKMCKKS
jgi:hypothetical protein